MASDKKAATPQEVKVFDKDGHERPVIAIWKDLYPDLTDRAYEMFEEGLSERQISVPTDFGTDAESAKANIEQLFKELSDDKTVGAVTALVTVYNRAKKGPAKSGSVGIPKLPAGEKFDLSKPTISVGGVDYKIPTRVITPSAAALPDPVEFDDEIWITLAKRCGILFGLDMNKTLSTNSAEYSNAPAEKAALVWRVPDEGTRFFTTNTRFGSESTLSYSEHFASSVHNSIFSADAHVSAPFGAGAASFSRNVKHATASGQKKVYLTGLYLNSYVNLNMRACTALSDDFISALRETVGQSGSTSEKFRRLEKFFEAWGHVVSTNVELGGAMYYLFNSVITSSASEDVIKTTAKAAVDLKLKRGSGGGGASWQDASGKTVSDKNIEETASWDVIGGDRSLVGSPDTWSQSLKDPNTWEICRRVGVTPIIDWLDDIEGGAELKMQVETIWEEGLTEIWGGKKRPAEFIYPVLENKPFQIRTGTNVNDATLKAVGEGDLPGKDGFHTTFPLQKHNVDQSDGEFSDYHWILVYSGHTSETSGRGEPLYLIVTYGSEKAAAQLRYLGNPGRYSIALASMSFPEFSDNMKRPPLAVWQLNVFGDKKPVSLPERDSDMEHLFWTVEPVIDGNTQEEDKPLRYRVRSMKGRALAIETTHILKNIPAPTIGVARGPKAAKEAFVYLIPPETGDLKS